MAESLRGKWPMITYSLVKIATTYGSIKFPNSGLHISASPTCGDHILFKGVGSKFKVGGQFSN